MHKTITAALAIIAAVGWYRAGAADGEAERLREYAQQVTMERHVALTNRKLSAKTVRRIVAAGFVCAEREGLDPSILFAVMHQESHFNPRAVGADGERGLTQIMQTTAAEIGLPWSMAFDIDANVCAGAAYLAGHIRERGIRGGLKRYNGGDDYPRMVLARVVGL